MQVTTRRLVAFIFSASWCMVSLTYGELREEATIQSASAVFSEIMSSPLNAIPAHLLVDAHGVAIVPNVIKGSFIVGARHGNGVLIVRDDANQWRAPVFISLTGGNVGWQVGIQSTDVILVFKTKKSVDGLLSRKLTLGADAAIAAGPVGRQAAAATDSRLQAEVYSYSRSRGLFAGVSFDGSMIQLDSLANASYYRTTAEGEVVVPVEAVQLTQQVAGATGVVVNASTPNPTTSERPALTHSALKDKSASVRDELARSAHHLYDLVDDAWQKYLALPVEVFRGEGHPSAQALAECQRRFDAIRTDARYTALTNRSEFQATYSLLRHYSETMSVPQGTLSLPPPPDSRP